MMFNALMALINALLSLLGMSGLIVIAN